MITKKQQRTVVTEIGTGKSWGILNLECLLEKESMPSHLRMYSRVYLEPGACVGYHEHHGEAECYYILSGHGEYDDGGVIYPVEAGDVTYTPDGCGHGIKNIGDEMLEFIALTIENESQKPAELN